MQAVHNIHADLLAILRLTGGMAADPIHYAGGFQIALVDMLTDLARIDFNYTMRKI